MASFPLLWLAAAFLVLLLLIAVIVMVAARSQQGWVRALFVVMLGLFGIASMYLIATWTVRVGDPERVERQMEAARGDELLLSIARSHGFEVGIEERSAAEPSTCATIRLERGRLILDASCVLSRPGKPREASVEREASDVPGPDTLLAAATGKRVREELRDYFESLARASRESHEPQVRSLQQALRRLSETQRAAFAAEVEDRFAGRFDVVPLPDGESEAYRAQGTRVVELSPSELRDLAIAYLPSPAGRRNQLLLALASAAVIVVATIVLKAVTRRHAGMARST